MARMKSLTIEIEVGLYDRFEKLCNILDVDAAQFIEGSIEDFIKMKLDHDRSIMMVASWRRAETGPGQDRSKSAA